MQGQDLTPVSNYGLVSEVNGALLKQAAIFSLGNTHFVDDVHPSLNIAFIYPQGNADPRSVQIRGLDSVEVSRLEEAVTR